MKGKTAIVIGKSSGTGKS